MRFRAIAAVIGLSCAAAAPIVATEAVASPVAEVACVHATIGGHAKCLAVNQRCMRKYERQYERYGFACTKRDRAGHYHLRAQQQQQG